VSRALLLWALLAGCRGQPSDKPPIHLVPDMDWQPKYQAEEASAFFADGRAMRPLEEGTVARGQLHEDGEYWRGRVGDKYVAKVPIPVDRALIRRGQDRFNIYCSPCHDRTGSGKGMVVRRGYPQPVDLTGDRAKSLPDGQIFDTISRGARNMPAYRKQIPVEDRWAIVTWVRVLERSQQTTLADIPPDQRDRIQLQGTNP